MQETRQRLSEDSQPEQRHEGRQKAFGSFHPRRARTHRGARTHDKWSAVELAKQCETVLGKYKTDLMALVLPPASVRGGGAVLGPPHSTNGTNFGGPEVFPVGTMSSTSFVLITNLPLDITKRVFPYTENGHLFSKPWDQNQTPTKPTSSTTTFTTRPPRRPPTTPGVLWT